MCRNTRSGRTIAAAHGARTLVLALVMACALVLASATAAFAITRGTVLARAQSWVDKPVVYSQSRYHLGYRTDCSGYVSMCWDTGTSWATMSFHNVTHRIPADQLKPGDAMLKAGYHIRLFYGWLDAAHTTYVAYESGNGTVAICRIHSFADDIAFGYVPVRYDHISASPASFNVLRNSSFDSWARTWGSNAEEPVWWNVDGPWGYQTVQHLKSGYRSQRNALALLNPSQDPDELVVLSQDSQITSGVPYRLTAYARTAYDPSLLSVDLSFLDAYGQSIEETTLAGSDFALNPSTYAKMSLLVTSPVDAVQARVAVRLGGGYSLDASGNVIPGSSAMVDDVTLARPAVGITVKSSATTTYHGRRITLSGAVTPASTVGTEATVWIQRPGSSWKQLARVPITASGSAGAWSRSFTFTRSMPTGTYRFKTSVPSVPGYLGNTSGALSVRLR